ncbi:hypothetical protein TNCV_2746801 [Trichonephila clavipes]|nr:hypothetical protein TNCV_2746801 [Trichonephila clavipes]
MRVIFTWHNKGVRELLLTDLVNLNRVQVKKTTSEPSTLSPNFHTTPTKERLILDLSSVNFPPHDIWWKNEKKSFLSASSKFGLYHRVEELD